VEVIKYIMGLEEFKTEKLNKGDTYYEIEMVAEVEVEHPRIYEELPRQIRDIIPSDVDGRHGFATTTIPFSFKCRGYTRDEAYKASRQKLDRVENQDMKPDVAEVIRIGIVGENIEEIEKDW